jgi:hypothetical protein
MSFAMVGCSGDPTTGAYTKAVAKAISEDKDLSFFYHLGDLIYTISGSDTDTAGDPLKPYSPSLWDDQSFDPYARFPKKIFAIAGNHDGKYTEKTMALRDFFRFFCAGTVEPPTGSKYGRHRRQMNQPYIYWSLNTPYAYIIGLYSNIANGGILDKPTQYTKANFTEGPQYKWLVSELKAAAGLKQPNGKKKPVLLTVHYPPYSGTTNFNVRGDQSKGGRFAKGKRPAQPNNYNVPYLAQALQQAFKDSGQRPDAIFSAHAHLYQRLNYKFADGTTMPCLVVGCGGHTPLEKIFEASDGTLEKKRVNPHFPAVTPGKYQLPKGDKAEVKYFDDADSGGSFGYLKITLDAKAHTLTCQFMAVKNGKPVRMIDGHMISLSDVKSSGAALATAASSPFEAPAPVPGAPPQKLETPSTLAIDNVLFTLTGQSVLAPGQAYELLFWAHVEQQKETVLAQASAALDLPLSEISVRSEGPYPLQRGSRLSVRLKVDCLRCLDNHKWITWTGEIGRTAFVVEVPKGTAGGSYAGKASIRLNGGEIAKMSFILRVGAPKLDVTEIPSQTTTHRGAFASYASQDRAEVLSRVQGMEAAYRGLNVFVDVVSLRPGQRWEKKIKERIASADVFYLFWCRHAKSSTEVEKEWRWALEANKGEDFITPIPLETPDLAPPPQELAASHFNDPLLACIAAAGGGHP